MINDDDNDDEWLMGCHRKVIAPWGSSSHDVVILFSSQL